MIDRADLLMEYNNDLSRSEAEAIISSNQEQVNPQEEVVQVEDNNNQ